MDRQQRCWAIIPAAGSGTRMGAETPKQYLRLRDRYVLEYSVELFCRYEKINGVVVVLGESDPYWQSTTMAGNARVMTTNGGEERCHSVINGLNALRAMADDQDWVMVHDAARPCLQASEIDKMLLTLEDHPVGGILALPVRDTMKRGGPDNRIVETVDRRGLWHALTPQMFRYGILLNALEIAIAQGVVVTDESQAIELAGKHPALVEGSAFNIKITRSADLEIAELFLSIEESNP